MYLMDTVGEKEKRVAFYELIEGRKKFNLKGSLDAIFNSFRLEKYSQINELTVNDTRYYLSAIQKFSLDGMVNYGEDTEECYCYAINIANVDSSQQVKYGDLSKIVDERSEVVNLDNADMTKIGPLFDTQILIDPFYSVVAVSRTNGGTNMWALKKFFQCLFDVKGLRFAFIPDEKSINDINAMSAVTSISYKVSKNTNVVDRRRDSRPEMGDVRLAHHLSASEYFIKLKSAGMDKPNLIAKIKSIFHNDEFDDVESINIEGIEEGQEVFYNLLKNKLDYKGRIQFDRSNGITIKDSFNYLDMAYDTKFDFIQKNLFVREYGENNGGTSLEK